MSSLIERQAAIETVRKAKSIGQAHRMLLQLPSAQPDVSDTNVGKICEYYDLCRNGRDEKKLREELLSAQPGCEDTVYRKAVQMLLAYFVPEERYAEAVDGLRGLPSAQPGQRNARVFQGIIVEYPSISAYPEYEGKPYFSIKYTENGQEFIGYGTYKPEVLSEFLKEYFMSPAQPNLSEAYSKAVFTWLRDYQIRAAELKGRYTPYEVLSWVANDWRKEHERFD